MRSRVEHRRARRPGFTLLELVAALSLTGFALLGAWRLLDQLADGRDRLVRERTSDAQQSNGVRLLRALVSRAESGSDSTMSFTGNVDGASFTSWCEAPGGWLERCRVSLVVAVTRDSSAIMGRIDDGAALPLWRGRGRAAFRYFSATARDGRWWDVWGTSIAAPAAVGVVVDRDTLVLRVGGGA